jgi:hypothetical protein
VFSGVSPPRRARASKSKAWSESGWGGLVKRAVVVSWTKRCQSMERASSSLGQQAPARTSTLIPSTPLRGTPRAEALRSFYVIYTPRVVFLPPSHYLFRTHCRSPAVPSARALAWMSLCMGVVKGAKFLHEVHWICPLPGSCKLSVLTRFPSPPRV